MQNCRRVASQLSALRSAILTLQFQYRTFNYRTTNIEMKTILTAAQTREADRYTIETTPIASIDLMENASLAFVTVFMQLYPDKNTQVLICCGTGNNGGDGLAIARLLQEHSYDGVAVWIARFSERESDEFATNVARLYNTPIPITEFFTGDELPAIRQRVVIDALLGSGLNKPLQGDWL